jgi:type I restriction enzyme S subunit
LRRDGLLCTSPKIAESYRRSRVSAGDIVCAIRATVGKVLMVPPELDGANLTQGTARIAPAADVDGHCLLWALRSESVTAQIRSIQKGTTFQEITLQRLRSLAVRLPARRDDQEKLASVLRSAEGIVRAEQTSLVALKATRAGLAADLLSGRVRTAAA